jgi:hypothetical protein
MTGRPVRGFIGGLLLGLLLDIDLVFGGVVKLESVLLTILPVALAVVGVLLGLWAPLGRSKITTPTMARSETLPNVPSNVTTTPIPPATTPPAGEDTPPI